VVKEKTSALETEDEQIDALEEERVARLNDALDDFEKGLTEAQAGALESLDALHDAAEDVRDTELTDAAREIERFESSLEQQVEADDAALERGYGELAQAFDGLETAAKDADAEYERVQQEAGEAFEALETALDEAQQRVDSGGDAAANAIEALTAALVSEKAPELQSDAEAAIAEWSALPGALEGDCDAGAQALTSLYESAKTQAVSSGGELITATDVLDEALQALEPAATELATQVDTLQEVLGDLRLEGQALEGVLRPGAEAAEELLPLLADLATAVTHAGEIREALDTLEA
jgi:chromosome segregation ATPase